MKKYKQRKGTVGLALIGLILILISCNCAWDAFTHKGNGVWTSGGDDTDQKTDVVSESQYKRHCYAMAAILLAVGLGVWWEAGRNWKYRNELEASWRRAIANPDNIRDIHKNPELFRDDFRAWIKENHPHLAFWELPPNSSN